MKRTLEEQLILLLSLLKWFILATIVGVITGLSTTLFLKILGLSSKSIQQYQYYFLLLPLILFLSSTIVKYLAPDAEGHGTEKILEAVHKRSGKIKLRVVPVKLVATIITLAGGGSAGKEGPCAQIGAGLASGVADILRLNDQDRKKIVICGISAGFTTVFGTPLAGAIFAVEVLLLGRLLTEYLFPALISAIIGFKTATLLGIEYFHHTFEYSNSLNMMFYLQTMLSGIYFGIVAILLIEIVKYAEKLSHQLKWWKPLKGLLGGTILVALVFIFGKEYLGLGTDTVERSIQGQTVPYYAFLLKIIFTSITLSMGGSGGILSPIFFIGTTAGSAFASLLGLDHQMFSAIGLVALFAAATNSPITAIVMFIELFGLDLAPYAGLAIATSYLFAGHRSVYPSQVIATSKTSSILIEPNTEMRNIKVINIRKIFKKRQENNQKIA